MSETGDSLPTPFYQDGSCTIYHGDCGQLMPFVATPVSCDLVTDPPYGIGEANGKPKQRSKPFGRQIKTHNPRGTVIEAKDYLTDRWDSETKPKEINVAIDLTCWAIVFGGNYYPLPPSSCWLVWDKDNSGDFADCELAWTNMRKAVRKFKWRWNGMLQEKMGRDKETRWHPTQKPVALMRWAISQLPESDRSIFDPFAGSGSTLVAAKLEGRKAVGIEIEERYCEIAANRLRQGVLDF